MSGNPMGLSEINHFGSFTRVGGKAGGFIAKKFFHPSSFRNQEKLWKALEADAAEKKKQEEHEKRRDEERQVEELRRQMYLAGQGTAADNAFNQAEEEKKLTVDERSEHKASVDEQRRRKQILKKERIEREQREQRQVADSEEVEDEVVPTRKKDVDIKKLAKSRYPEDVEVRRHKEIWGSWYSAEQHQWGFACCKVMDHLVECPLNVDETVGGAQASEEPKGKKRRRNEGAASASALSSPAPPTAAETTEKPAVAKAVVPDSQLIDTRMFAAKAARLEREAKKQEEKDIAEQNKKNESGYLANLLEDPATGSEKTRE